MPCYWETSQRPLFVKSVWQNGYRHAILSKEDPAAKTKSPRQRPKSQNGLERRPNSITKEEHLNIPAVQLLLANARKMKRDGNKTAPQHRERLQKSLTFDLILREDIKITSKNNMLNKENDIFSPLSCEKTVFANDRLQQNSTSLTERVLLWLDLAGRQTKKKYAELSNRVLPEKQIIQEYPNLTSSEENFETKNDIDRIEADFSILGNHTYKPTKIELGFEEEQYRLTNVEGEHVLMRKDCLESRFNKSTKRKVHIFIPNIRNKIPECPSDCNSILSYDSKQFILDDEI